MNVKNSKRILALILSVITAVSLVLPASAAKIRYMPDVTAQMSEPSYWAERQEGADEIILTPEEIKAFNEDTYLASGTMVMDLRTYTGTFDGKARNEAVKKSSTADAEYYFGWTYEPDGEKANWSYYQKMINNCVDPDAKTEMPLRYGIAVERTTLRAFPSENPIWDDPADRDFDYQHISAVQVNDPLVLYTTSADGKFYLARSRDCSGWIAAADVAVCKDKAEWESAWVIDDADLLVVYGNKVYTDMSYEAPETSRRMLAQGTRLELVRGLEAGQLVNNRYPYHNYVVYLPVRREDGSYEKKMAMLPETAKVSEGFLPLTMENIAMAALQNLGDTYGWGGMMDVEDCSGLIRTIYACFGLEIGRNGNWQWKMNMEKVDMANMSIEEKLLILDELPLGAALCFPGHEMLYLGKDNGKHYVLSTVGSIMGPDTGSRLRVRGVMINTLDVQRANGQTWLQALDMAFMPCYAKLEGKSYDFPTVQWYREGVRHTLKNGLISNDENGYFKPHDMASRAVAVSALWRLDGKPETAFEEIFTDISADALEAQAICWADANGIANGYADGTFRPDATLSREQMVTFLWRYAQHKGFDVSAGTDLGKFADAYSVSKYAEPAMQWACRAGLIVGEKTAYGTVLDPKSSTTRAQLSMMLMRFDAWLDQAALAPQVFDLSEGDLILSSGQEAYEKYLAAEKPAEKAPAPAFASQDGGKTWTALKGELTVVTSVPTDHSVVLDFDAPYGDITVTLDGVDTTGDIAFSPGGDAAVKIRGDVRTGTIVTGLDRSITVCGAEGEQKNTLTVSSTEYGIIASCDVHISRLDELQIRTSKDGILSEDGNVTLEGVSGSICAGEKHKAIKTEGRKKTISVNGSTVTEKIGREYILEEKQTQEG